MTYHQGALRMDTTLDRLRNEVAVDPETQRRWLDRECEQPKELPDRWTPEHVADRLVEAFETLRATPARTHPKEFGNGWPGYREEWTDWLAQAELTESERADREYARNRVRIPPSSEKVSRMDDALRWPLRFLATGNLRDQERSKVLLIWAFCKANGRSIRAARRRFGWSSSTFHRLRQDALDTVAASLDHLAVPVS